MIFLQILSSNWKYLSLPYWLVPFSNHISNIFRSCLRTYVPRISVSCRLKLRPLQAKSQRYGGLYGMSDVCLFPPFLPILSVACWRKDSMHLRIPHLHYRFSSCLEEHLKANLLLVQIVVLLPRLLSWFVSLWLNLKYMTKIWKHRILGYKSDA